MRRAGPGRIAVIGNAGGGKSTLARHLAARWRLPHIELDTLLWQPDWSPKPSEVYEAGHAQAIAADRWIIDGLGQAETIQVRLDRATRIILIDMPVWMHFWLAAERQLAWNVETIDHPPAGASNPPPTEALFRTIDEVDRNWMPKIREQVAAEETRGKQVDRIENLDQFQAFARAAGFAAMP